MFVLASKSPDSSNVPGMSTPKSWLDLPADHPFGLATLPYGVFSTDDPDLRRRYGDEVPVTLVDGARHDFWRIDPDRLRTALTR
jgi:hypothetical protein